ncbi:MAG: hypothetical protein PWP59_2071 [Sphaerochaeta sp.]|jgi:hypothetical protein|nr:hypothetical protein [Sphaerochaeta sp.]
MSEQNLNRIQDNNWKQGVMIENDLKDQLLSSSEFFSYIKDSDVLVLYSQDCDLINPSLDKEPFAEFFCAKKIESIESNFAFGKNPRKLHQRMPTGIILEFDINRRLTIERSRLADIRLEIQNPSIPRDQMDIILDWYSKKYTRPAFPDTFNKILKTKRNIDQKLTHLNNEFPCIKRLFFLLDPEEEIAPTEMYKLKIIILLSGLSLESDETVKDTIHHKFEALFQIDRIALEEMYCLFEDEMTLYELGIYKVWDKEYITLRSGCQE